MGVPLHEFRPGFGLVALRRPQWLVVKVSQPPQRVALTVDFTRDQNLETPLVGLEAERAAVECLVVDYAQRKSVRNDVRAAGSVPLDVRRLQSEELVLDANVEAADGATALVLAQNLIAKSRIAPGGVRAERSVGDVVGEAGGGTDVVVKRTGEVPVQEGLSGFVDEPGAG